jgi:hypothetical protein
LHVACCLLHVVCCMLSAECYTLHVVCCSLHVARCLLSVARCILSDARCTVSVAVARCKRVQPTHLLLERVQLRLRLAVLRNALSQWPSLPSSSAVLYQGARDTTPCKAPRRARHHAVRGTPPCEAPRRARHPASRLRLARG